MRKRKEQAHRRREELADRDDGVARRAIRAERCRQAVARHACHRVAELIEAVDAKVIDRGGVALGGDLEKEHHCGDRRNGRADDEVRAVTAEAPAGLVLEKRDERVGHRVKNDGQADDQARHRHGKPCNIGHKVQRVGVDEHCEDVCTHAAHTVGRDLAAGDRLLLFELGDGIHLPVLRIHRVPPIS